MTPDEINSLYQIGGAVGILAAGGFFGLRWVLKTVATMETGTVKTEKTTIITGDTVAMDSLAKTIEASNVILTENNVLRREEHADRNAMREAIEENTKAVERSTVMVAEARMDVKALALEIARSGK